MNQTPSVSVVMPCFNAQACVAQTLRTVLDQSHTDIEVLAVDDGSSDATADIVSGIAGTDPRVRLIRQQNGGVSVARNTGIAQARGEIIALIDSDDLWAPSHLAVHVARLQRDRELGVSFSPARIVDLAGQPTGVARPKLKDLRPVDFLTSNPTTTCSTLVIRCAVFADVGAFNARLRRDEDQEWLFRVSVSKWRLSGHHEALVDYRTSPGGLASDLNGMLDGFYRMLELARGIAPEVVRGCEPIATATTLRYLARRALRLGLDRRVARGYILRALATAPSMLIREPRQTIATLAAALVPGGNALIFGQPQHS